MALNETDPALDEHFIATTMQLATERGWHGFTLVEAAMSAGIPPENVKKAYPFKPFILIQLNNMVDKAMLCRIEPYPTLREGLFDLFMRRFDAFQDYRGGIITIMHAIPFDPALAAFSSAATLNTVKWIADAAGLDRRGLSGKIRLQTLLAIWIGVLRAWEKDTTPDLEATMSALDKALDRAERFHLFKEAAHLTRQDVSSQNGLPDYKAENTATTL